jgi:hypothetical protein
LSATVLHGDCIERMRDLDDSSVDSIVTDPPAGISFMGKAWDGDKGGRDQWVAWMQGVAAEAMRVAKPGAHALVWALPRTSHWTAMAWDNAGWEVRDRVAHMFGTGFPKSHNLKDEWEGWGTALKPAMEDWWLLRKPLSEGTVAANVLKYGCGALNIDATRVDGKRWPANVIHDSSDEVLAAFAQFGESRSDPPGLVRKTTRDKGSFKVTNGVNEAGSSRGGFGDSGTAARFFYSAKAGAKDRIVRDVEEVTVEWTSEQGRCLVKLQADTAQSLQKAIVVSGSMDGSEWSTFLFGSGITDLFRKASKCTTSTKTNSTTGLRTWNCLMRSLTNACIADVSCETESGGSRASSAASGPQSLTITLAETAYLPGASLALSGTQLRISASARKHSHPTCKPLSLMRYLCKLVTPPGGTVLDMFAGSGTTLQAALEEGFNAIGIEREAEYHADILRRLEMARKAMGKPAPKPKAIRVAKPGPRKPANTDTPTLFDLMMCESA